MSDPCPRLLSVTEACWLLGIGRTNLYALMGAGELPSVRLGGRRLIPSTVITDLIAAAA